MQIRILAGTAFAVLAALVVAAPAQAAEDLLVEGEEYETYGSLDLGGVLIQSEFCSGASGFLAAGGLDIPGEWIRLKVTFPTDGCYRSTIAYQSAYSDHVELVLRLADAPAPGGELTSTHWLTDGWGFG